MAGFDPEQSDSSRLIRDLSRVSGPSPHPRAAGSCLNDAVQSSTRAGLEAISPLRIGARAGLVRRARLVDELQAASEVPVVLVVGGGGFGKTTLVSQWLHDDPRLVVWLTATRQHDDPAVLLADIVRLLDEFEPLEPARSSSWPRSRSTSPVCWFPGWNGRSPSARSPFVLVIDDAQRLRRRPVWSLVQALADCVPAGSQLVLISRTEPELALGRMRADRRVHTVATASLAMDRAETGELFEVSGLSLPASAGRPAVGSHRGLAGRALPGDARARRRGRSDRGGGAVRGRRPPGRRLRARGAPVRAPSAHPRLPPPRVDARRARSPGVRRSARARRLGEGARRRRPFAPAPHPARPAGRGVPHAPADARDAARRARPIANPTSSRCSTPAPPTWYEAAGDIDRAVDHRLRAGDPPRLEAVIWRVAPLYVARAGPPRWNAGSKGSRSTRCRDARRWP